MDQASLTTIEENLALAWRFVDEVLGGGNPNAFDELVADDIKVTTILKPVGIIEGKYEYIKVLGETVSGTFADREISVRDLAPLLDGRVVARIQAKATHVGDVFGIAATHRRLRMHELLLMRFRQGKLAELYVAGLTPLEFEMLFAPAIAPMLFKN